MIYISTVTPQEFHGSIAPRGAARHWTGAAPHRRECICTKFVVVETKSENLILSSIYLLPGLYGPCAGRPVGPSCKTCQLKRFLTTTIARQLLVIILSIIFLLGPCATSRSRHRAPSQSEHLVTCPTNLNAASVSGLRITGHCCRRLSCMALRCFHQDMGFV